ncbi:MAG TPA: hypothetical protein H9887_00705, partial [Candidatus Dorea intestinavium]|nr:hypothetical protein [Candidatus Dorea intestinavium]
MKVIETIRSKERCTESGWDAYDLVLSKPLDDAFIKALRPLGSLTYLAMLKKPFFKIENNN